MDNIKVEFIKIENFDSLIMTEENGNTTICYNEEGGAVISHENREEAIKRYSEAMNLSESIKKLLYYKHTNEFPSVNIYNTI